MKKSLFYKSIILAAIQTTLIVSIIMSPTIVSAVDPRDELIPHYVEFEEVNKTSGSKLGVVYSLPGAPKSGQPQDTKSWQVIIASIIKTMLNICGALAAVSFTYGGVMMVTAQGNEDKIKKGKNVLLYSILALIVIAVSYAIILGITQLKFFT